MTLGLRHKTMTSPDTRTPDAMNPSSQHSVDTALDQIETRLQALMRLRFQMLKAHARLEYFRLLMRLQRR
ncbi:MAG: hypothetical protein ABIR94_17310 [Rubrivivax sp.]